MAAPVNTVLPAITGTVAVGQALALSNGTWNGSPTSYAYAWLRDSVAISGATAAAYTLTLTDVAALIVGRVTATNVDGSTAADSAATIAVPTTLIVEDGTEVAGANSYQTRAAADTYHAQLGNTAWAALTVGAREAALVKATAYMEQFYRSRWKGWRVSSTQVLCWPRANVEISDTPYGTLVATDEIPQAIKDACSEYALKASTATLAPDLTRGKASVTVGPIAVTYDTASPEAKRYRALDALLRPYLKGSSVNVELVAA